MLKLSFMRPEPVFFFRDVVLQAIAHRRAGGKRKNDLIDLALDALSKAPKEANEAAEEAASEGDQFEKDALVKSNLVVNANELEELLVANAIQLFLAGYETTSTVMAVAMYFLAKNPDMQDCLRAEVDEAIEAAGQEVLDYSQLQSLDYMEAFLLEAARQHPVSQKLNQATVTFSYL